MSDVIRLALEQVHATAMGILATHGFNLPHRTAIANTVTAAERDECPHHGMFRIPFYVNAVRAGQASPDAEPTFTNLAPGMIKVDAHYGFAPLALERGDEPVGQRAMEQGIAALAGKHAHH